MRTLIVIPARYGSTRLPGKPLAMIAGKTMLQRVYELAQSSTADFKNVDVLVATDDTRIMDHAAEIGAPAVMTPESCPTGTDRAFEAVKASGLSPDVVLNLQGDAPLTPPHFIRQMIRAFDVTPVPDVVTPAYQLTWDQLDDMRNSKRQTPFSGTSVICGPDGYALWFSKNIIPAIRKEDKLRVSDGLSPVIRHIGLYAYHYPALEKYVTLDQSRYEQLEGLEQLRLLENGMRIKIEIIDPKGEPIHGGVDSPEDIERVERVLAAKH